ncbi:hypothetical protein Tco_1541480 [Tanacetum coccineum]
MELHDVSYGIRYAARPLLLFFSSENQLLWFRYREYDLAHLKLIFEFPIYNVWKSVQYGISNGLDTAYWGFLGVGTTFGTDTPYLPDGYGVLVFRIVIFKISSFKLQNARLLLCFTNYSIITAILNYKRLSNNSLQ